MDWDRLDRPTKGALVATAIAFLTILVPPISMAMAVLAVAFSGVAMNRARRSRAENRLALGCLVASSALIAVVVIGSAIYAAGS